MGDDLENVRPIAELVDFYNKLGDTYHKMGDSIENVIERDLNLGLYKLPAGIRKEMVLLLRDQGMSNRQIAKMLNVSPPTIDRDVNATNVAPNGPNATNVAPKSKSIRFTEEQVQERIQQAIDAEYEKLESQAQAKVLVLEKQLKEGGEHISKLQSRVGDLNLYAHLLEKQQKENKRGVPSFGAQIHSLTAPLSSLLQSDHLSALLNDLAALKDQMVLESDLNSLSLVVQELKSLSARAEAWAQRLTKQEK